MANFKIEDDIFSLYEVTIDTGPLQYTTVGVVLPYKILCYSVYF